MHTPINIGYEENIQINRKIYTKNKISSKKNISFTPVKTTDKSVI